MDTATKASSPADTLRSYAANALEVAGNDVIADAAALAERAMTDKEFLNAYFEDVIRTACYSAVSACLRDQRRAVWQLPQPTTQERRAQITALAAGTIRTLHDFLLPGGKRLGDATREEVSEAADFFGKQARDMAWKSRWLAHVAQSLPSGKRVREAISAERLEELRQEISR